MKYIIVFLLSFAVQAGQFDVQLTQFHRATDEDVYMVGGWEGIEIKYSPDNTDVFYSISQENARVIPKGSAFTYTFTGLSVGKRFKITKNVKLFGKIGYYKVDNDLGIRNREYNEGLYYYLNDRWRHVFNSVVHFDEYGVDSADTFGGAIGLEMTHELSENLSINFVMSHRLMKIKEKLYGYNDLWKYDETGNRFEFGPNRDYSSTNFGINLEYRI